MDTKKIIGIALVVIVVGIGGWKIIGSSSSKSSSLYNTDTTSGSKIPETMQTSGTTSGVSNETTTTAKTTFTLADIAKHNNASSCYTTINGGVYDLTNWVNQHPGGEGAILSICGIDGSSAFNGQHGEQGKPERMLATFKIGTLTQ